MSIQYNLVLLAFLGFITAGHAAAPAVESPLVPRPAKERQAVTDRNAILGVQVESAPGGGWMVTVEYHYTGAPAGARLEIKQAVTSGEANPDPVTYRAAGTVLQKGQHRVQLPLERPGDEADRFTQQVIAEIRDARESVIASAVLAQRFEWPDAAAQRREAQFAGRKPEVLLAQAVGLIDTDEPGALRQAKLILERLVQRSPQMDQAYLELARVAMKTNWGPDGLRQAEALIQSALQLRPDSVDASILLGYVYANQGRAEQAVALFEEAARKGTDNLWLWTNWGELLMQQGNPGRAIEKFREAIRRPPTRDGADKRGSRHTQGSLRSTASARVSMPWIRSTASDAPITQGSPATNWGTRDSW